MQRRLAALILALAAEAALAQSFEPVGEFGWDHPAVNEVSGLVVAPDGAAFTAISDRGWWIEGWFERDQGAISGVADLVVRPILGLDGLPVSARRVGDWSDAEGLTRAADGTLFVAFERYARVWAYADTASTPTHPRDHPTFSDYDDNRQLEAAATGPDGPIALTEQPLGDSHPVYGLRQGRWEITGQISVPDRYAITGADAGPDGALYLLERRHALGRRFIARIRRIGPDGQAATLWQGGWSRDNFEALALWQAPDGLRAVMMSDNAGTDGAPTRIVELRLTGGS